jgi:glycine/D-amino acid oxidase-like deaminating enzyme/nitrite reductase/ring-hydroxylating ferredoxin subunit
MFGHGYGPEMTISAGRPESYWMDSSAPTTYPAIDRDVTVDVAVVGGGIAGICAAWEIAATGRAVALFEADRIAAGTTGYTSAKLSAQHTLIYAGLRADFDAGTARDYASAQLAAIERVVETADRLGIDCDLERAPSFTYVTEEKNVQSVRDEVDAAMEAGLPASLTTETGLPFPVAAAIRVENQVQFHPRRYLLGLAADLIALGGQIFERTRVVDLDEGEPCRLRTESGVTVTAGDVVVATHYPIFDRALLFPRLVPHRELVVAGPIPADQDPAGMYITSEQNTRSVRTAPYRDGQRLLIVTGEGFQPGEPEVSARLDRLAGWTREHFAVETLDYHWAAQDNRTTDRLPYIGPLHPRARHAYVATGFGGWGMSNGVAAGQLLAALLDGDEPAWAKHVDPRRLHPIVEAPALLKAAASVARHLVGDRIRPPSHADSPADLGPGTGAVIRVDGERCAVYRDEDGTLSAVSAICTHLGCVVAFNDVERTWDCPCHGSRFGTDGAVRHGPAIKPLEHRELKGQQS